MSALQTPLRTVLNFRDVGETINEQMGRKYIRSRILYRGARPDEASTDDRRQLREEFGVKIIIDLRTKTEHIQQAQKRDGRIARSEFTVQSNEQTAESVKIAGIEYREINFNGWAFSRSLISRLSWWDFGRLLSLMATGYRVEAIRILGENVMRPRGLIGLAKDSLDVCTAEVLEVFQVLAEPANYPLMLHCTQGKDRTGLLVLLILLLIEVPSDCIRYDYMLSGPELQPEREERLKEIRSIGLSDDFADCDPDLVQAVIAYIHEKHGSIENYLESYGVTSAMQSTIRSILRANG